MLRHEHCQWYEHFLERCSTMIALFLLGIPHSLTPRHNNTLYPRDLLPQDAFLSARPSKMERRLSALICNNTIFNKS